MEKYTKKKGSGELIAQIMCAVVHAQKIRCFSIAELAKGARIHRNTAGRYREEMLRCGFIRQVAASDPRRGVAARYEWID
jgi:DNA-binding IclR family transcriptional regulator